MQKVIWFVVYAVLGAGLLLLVLAAVNAGRTAQQAAYYLTHPPKATPGGTPDAVGIDQWEDVSFTTLDDKQIAAWFVPPKSEVDGAVIILVHGFGADRSRMLEEAAVFHEAGYGLLLLDLRNHGQSDGAVTTWGGVEAADVIAAAAYLQGRPEVNPDRIGALGKSMGGAAVLRAAAREPGIKVVAAMSTYSTFVDNLPSIATKMGGVPETFSGLVLRFMEREAGYFLTDVNGLEDVAAISPRPLLFVHGEQDLLVAPSHSQALYDAASEPKQLTLVPGAGHTDILATNPDLFRQDVVGFFDAYLRP